MLSVNNEMGRNMRAFIRTAVITVLWDGTHSAGSGWGCSSGTGSCPALSTAGSTYGTGGTRRSGRRSGGQGRWRGSRSGRGRPVSSPRRSWYRRWREGRNSGDRRGRSLGATPRQAERGQVEREEGRGEWR